MKRFFPSLLTLLVTLLASGCLLYGDYQLRTYGVPGGYIVHVATRIDIANPQHSPDWIQEREKACSLAKAEALGWLQSNGYHVTDCAVVGGPPAVNQGGAIIIELAAGDVLFVRQAVANGSRAFNGMIDNSSLLGSAEGKFP